MYLASARITKQFWIVIQQPKTAYKVRSTAPALAVCHPGASYNPTFEDHQVGKGAYFTFNQLHKSACSCQLLEILSSQSSALASQKHRFSS